MSSRIPQCRAFNETYWFLWILAILFASPLLAAASAISSPQQKQTGNAVEMSRDWKQTRTPNFTAFSNAPAGDVRKILEQLEIFRSSLFTKFLAPTDSARDPVLVVIFYDANSFSRFKPRDEKGKKRENVGGYFLSAPDMNYIVLPRYQESYSLHTIFHEYYHYMVHRNIPDIPLWLNEGLAEFYSTSECDPKKGENLIGRVIPRHLQMLQGYTLLPLEQILTHDGAMKALRDKSDQSAAMFYAQSWALVHYLMLRQNASRGAQIMDYLNALKQGMPIAKAFQTAFGATFDETQKELKAYSKRYLFPAVRIPRSQESIARNSASEPLTEVEADYIQGDLLLRAGAYDDAERMFVKVQAREPSHIAAQIALAEVRSAQERYREALDILRPIISTDPDNFRAHLSFAAASYNTDQFEDALREYKRAVAIKGQAPAALLGESYAALALGRQADADEAMSRLQRVDPNPRWYNARAYERFKKGDYSAAIRDVYSYIALAGRGAESAPYAAFLGAICHLRMQHPAEADKLLQEVSPEIPQDSWTAAVMDFMRGKLPSKQFLARAKDVYERTEAHAYTGIMALIAGNRDEALDHLNWVKEKGSRNYVEYGMSVAELKRMEADYPKAVAKNTQ